MRATSIATSSAAGVLAAIAGLHVSWGLGSSFPLRSRESLFENVAGGGGNAPGPLACFAVAGCLATAATTVAGYPRSLPRARRGAAITTSAALGGRAALGFSGRSYLVAPGQRVSETFTRQDRRVYSPMCLALAIAAVPAWASA